MGYRPSLAIDEALELSNRTVQGSGIKSSALDAKAAIRHPTVLVLFLLCTFQHFTNTQAHVYPTLIVLVSPELRLDTVSVHWVSQPHNRSLEGVASLSKS